MLSSRPEFRSIRKFQSTHVVFKYIVDVVDSKFYSRFSQVPSLKLNLLSVLDRQDRAGVKSARWPTDRALGKLLSFVAVQLLDFSGFFCHLY